MHINVTYILTGKINHLFIKIELKDYNVPALACAPNISTEGLPPQFSRGGSPPLPSHKPPLDWL